ncbi:hypothetical protein CEXT_552831 [Caerostris extrusa]|uniref:Uncharacterized protein n=1 Tax=Caerostris extrusa TaxID=172846 RepID=A0AAV4QA84_CAEEX|nr:hypothetical protein CEXT_552831 [Caerostris extrusa]
MIIHQCKCFHRDVTAAIFSLLVADGKNASSVGCFVRIRAESRLTSTQLERRNIVTAMIEGQRILKEEVPVGRGGSEGEERTVSYVVVLSELPVCRLTGPVDDQDAAVDIFGLH